MVDRGTELLRSPRLILRRFTEEDASAMYKNWAHDERVTRWLTWEPHPSEELTRALIRSWCAEYDDPKRYHWVIVYEGEAIGSITAVQLDARNESVEIGYCIAFDYWNQGVTSEALRTVTEFLFARAEVHRIQVSHITPNVASGRVAQKCGYRFEGVRKGYFKLSDGRFIDVTDYALLREEWEEKKKERG